MSQPQPESPLRIQTPCPKKWEELTGRGAKRFCSECSLHVHDAGKLTRSEAQALVSGATSRVCMRIEYDASGAPLHRDTRPSWSKRAARWTLSAAAGLLAACNGSFSTPPPTDPAAGTDPAPQPGRLGEATTTKLGDVAAPPPPPEVRMGQLVPPQPPNTGTGGIVEPEPRALMGKVAAPQRIEVMGEASVEPAPTAPQNPKAPTDRDGG